MLNPRSSHDPEQGASRCACLHDDALHCARATDADGDTDDPCECGCHLSSDPYIEDDHSAIRCGPRHYAKGW